MSVSSSNTGADTAALVLMVIGLVAAVVMLFYIPFGIAPIGFLAVLSRPASALGTAASAWARWASSACAS